MISLFFHRNRLTILRMQHSADCKTVDLELNIEVNETLLPAKHGYEVTFSCSFGYLRGNAKAECQDGQIVTIPKESSLCYKIG